MNQRRLTILALLGVLLGLAPLAQASPPDQTWIGGFYDDADHDDVVLLVTEGLNAVQFALIPVLLLISVVVAHVPATPTGNTARAGPAFRSWSRPPLTCLSA